MLRTSSEAVKAPYHDSVKLALSRVGHQVVKLRSRILHARFALVDILPENGGLSRDAVSSEVVDLKIAALIFGAYACVDRDPHSLDLRRVGKGG